MGVYLELLKRSFFVELNTALLYLFQGNLFLTSLQASFLYSQICPPFVWSCLAMELSFTKLLVPEALTRNKPSPELHAGCRGALQLLLRNAHQKLPSAISPHCSGCTSVTQAISPHCSGCTCVAHFYWWIGEINWQCNTATTFFFFFNNKLTVLVSSVSSLKNVRAHTCVLLCREVKESLVCFNLLNDLLFWANAVIFYHSCLGEGENHLKWKLAVDAWCWLQYRLPNMECSQIMSSW